jgi:hypothetical protein
MKKLRPNSAAMDKLTALDGEGSPRWVEAGVVRCARCGELIEPGTPWDLGHVDGTKRKVYSGPGHRRCNRQTSTHRVRKVSRRWVAATPA